jgi:hypothetical protein
MVFIPRMDCSPSDNRSVQLPFTLIRKQFPVRLAFCMTINKAQGQTIKGRLGIYLPSPVFSHGQLYVAMSRSGAEHTVRVVIDHAPLAPNNRASAETPDQRTARQQEDQKSNRQQAKRREGATATLNKLQGRARACKKD